MFNSQFFGKIKTLLNQIEKNCVGAIRLGDHACQKADGAGSDDRAVFSGL